jgi:hypothetical protein
MSSIVSKLISGFTVVEENVEILMEGVLILVQLSKFSQKNVFINIAENNVLILLCNFLKYIYPNYSTEERGKGFEGEKGKSVVTSILRLLQRTLENYEILNKIPVVDLKFILSTLFEVIKNINCFNLADQFYYACYTLHKIFLFGANNNEEFNLFWQELLSHLHTVVDAYILISDGVNVIPLAQPRVGEGEIYNLFKIMFGPYLNVNLNPNCDFSMMEDTIISVEKANDLNSVSSEEGKHSAEILQNLENNLENAKKLILLELFDLVSLIFGCGLKGVNIKGLKFINV